MEIAGSIDDLLTSQSIKGDSYPDFEMLDTRIASALRDHLHYLFQKESQC